MRSQIVCHVDADVFRGPAESDRDYAIRLDEALTRAINIRQNTNNWKEWYLLSVTPAGSAFGPGWFTTVWELDDEQDEFSDGQIESNVPELKYGDIIKVSDSYFKLNAVYNDDKDGHVIYFDRMDEPLEPKSFSWEIGNRMVNPSIRPRSRFAEDTIR